MPTWPSPRSERLGTPDSPAIRFARGTYFGASWFTHLLRPVRLLAPCTDLTGLPANGAFTSRLSTARSPFPSLDITTTVSGLLCWRDFHPLEWQLASLQWSGRASDRCPWCIVSMSSLHSAISIATEPVHDHPTRRLQLRAASPYDRGRTIAHLYVPLPGVPTPHWRRDQQPGALPPRAGHLRR